MNELVTNITNILMTAGVPLVAVAAIVFCLKVRSSMSLLFGLGLLMICVGGVLPYIIPTAADAAAASPVKAGFDIMDTVQERLPADTSQTILIGRVLITAGLLMSIFGLSVLSLRVTYKGKPKKKK